MERSNPFNRAKYYNRGASDGARSNPFNVRSGALWAYQEYAEGYDSAAHRRPSVSLSSLDLY